MLKKIRKAEITTSVLGTSFFFIALNFISNKLLNQFYNSYISLSRVFLVNSVLLILFSLYRAYCILL